MAIAASRLDQLWANLVELANAQYASAEFERLQAVPMTIRRAQYWTVELTWFTLNRRDCWPFVMGRAPIDVKKLIWHHEEDELIGERAGGKPDHYALAVQEGEIIGLTPADFERPPSDGSRTCFYAWLHLAESSPWLQGLAASCALEMRNSNAIVRGGGAAKRRAEKWQAELGLPVKRQVFNAEHSEADVRHAQLLMQVANRYVESDEAARQVLDGARESLAIDRVFWGHLADALEVLN
jgi:pyrroloquinoline quinone (PQQ) biosynthesis protein C